MSPRAGLPRFLRLWPWVAVVLVLGLVVGFGAFERRTDQFVQTALGTEVDSHNLVFVITAGTLQAVPRTSGAPDWKVALTGTVRNPNDEALAPVLGPYGNFVVHDPASGLTAEPDAVVLGGSTLRRLVPPGDTTIPLTIQFTLPTDYVAQDGIELAISPMEHTANTVLGLGDGELVWNIDSYASAALLKIPLTRLPDAPR